MTPTIAKIIWLVFMLGWVALRQKPGRHSRRTAVSYSGRDLRERILMAASFTGLGIIPFVYVTAHFPRFADYPFMPLLAYLGTAVDVACFCLFLRTHHDLGKNWSVSLDLRESHTLVTGGVYGLVRHPMYSAFWLMAIAQALLLPNWIAGLSGLVGFGSLFFGRVGREEEMMLRAFGEEYRTYMARTARVVPWIY